MTARTTEDFDRWWNKHYLHTNNPRYRIYKCLFTNGVTLDYIDFLCNALAFGDRIAEMTRKAQPKKEQPGLLDKIAKVNEQEFSELIQFACNFVADYVLREIQKTVPLEVKKLLNLPFSQTTNLVEQGLSKLALWGTSRQDWVAEEKKAARRQRDKELETSKQKLIAKEPIYYVLCKYNLVMPRKRGNQPDSWGSFILLAITEHIRQEIGKPEHAMAMTLVRRIRQASPETKRQTTQSAESRIRQFKQANESWAQDIEWLKKQFRHSQRSHTRI
jgi:hypothetical protein